MNILETMLSSGEGNIVKQLAGQFGVTSDQATSAVSTLLPALAGGLKEKVAHGDTSGLADVISRGGFAQYVDNPSILATPAAGEQGKTLLSRIFGSGDLTNVISTVAEKTGISPSIVTSMLPIAATLLGAVVSKHTNAGSKLTDVVDQVASLGHSGIVDTVKAAAAKMFT